MLEVKDLDQATLIAIIRELREMQDEYYKHNSELSKDILDLELSLIS